MGRYLHITFLQLIFYCQPRPNWQLKHTSRGNPGFTHLTPHQDAATSSPPLEAERRQRFQNQFPSRKGHIMLYPEQIRNRIQNMAIQFVDHTRNVNPLKLDKLFYFADELAIRQMVFSISKQPYFTDHNGPVPVSINKKQGIVHAFSLFDVIREREDGTFARVQMKQFSDDEFNEREVLILKEICNKFQNATGEEMSTLSHSTNGPWDIVWNSVADGNRVGKYIPLETLIDSTFPPEEQERRRLIRSGVAKANAAFMKLPGVKARMELTR